MKREKSSSQKKTSLEKLKQQLYQAEIDGNTKLVRQIKAIIQRIKSLE